MSTAQVTSIDLEACAREPIHIIGTIQEHGLLLALSEPDFTIRQVSANAEHVLGTPPAELLGRPFRDVMGEAGFALFLDRLRSDQLSPASALRIDLGSPARPLNCVAHRHDGLLVVEFEVADGMHSLDSNAMAANIQIMLARMDRASTLLDYCDVAASEIQRVSGFDRVMIYRFDADWSGEIIAETMGAPIAEPLAGTPLSYRGLRFPAGDIPAQARQLFLLNPVRAIADLTSQPVPIVPELSPITGRPLDMTYTFLRSPSPVHVEYLQNMGVVSSLAVSIVVDGRLWGMVACHHHARRPIDWLTRSACELIARNLSLQITLRNSNELWHTQQSAQRLLDDYVGRLEASGARVDAASFSDPLFRDLIDADGLIVSVDGVIAHFGMTASDTELRAAVDALRGLAVRRLASSNQLRSIDPHAAAFANVVSGALYLDIGKRGKDYLLFLRREMLETVNWAGNPDKTVNADADGKLHPRRSFSAWQETVRGRARPWTHLELESAAFLGEHVVNARNAQRLRELDALEDAASRG